MTGLTRGNLRRTYEVIQRDTARQKRLVNNWHAAKADGLSKRFFCREYGIATSSLDKAIKGVENETRI